MKNPISVLRHLAFEKAPRMPQVVGAAILSGLGVATAGATLTYVVGYVAITAVTTVVLRALSPKIASRSGSSLSNIVDPVAPHEYVYGKVRKGGVRTYVESTGNKNKFLHMIIALAGHEVQAIDDIYLNDEIVTWDETSGLVTTPKWKNKVRIRKHLGNQTAADADLLAESNQITASFRGKGIAYLYVRLEYDQDVFSNGIPLVTAVVRGRKVYDPRSSSTSYNNNAALAIRDYLTSDFGLNDDEINEASFATSANISDEPIDLATFGTESQYEVNGVINADMTPRQVMEQMMTTCNGTLFWGQGAWQLRVAYYTAPIKTFTLDDLRGPISLDTRLSARDNFNRVTGTFINAAADYIPEDYPALESAAFLAEDSGVENTLDLQLPMTTSSAAAQRLAKLTLFRAREQMTFSADFGLEAFGVQVGDIVAFTNSRYGWTEKEFEVVGWNFHTANEGDIVVSLTLRETSAAAFAWDAEEIDIIGNNTNLPSYDDGLNIENLTATGGGRLQGDGTFINSVILSWDPVETSFLSHYRVAWKPLSDSSYSATNTSDNTIEISPLIDGVEYILRVRAVSISGVRGDWATITFTGGGDITAPAKPTGITATGEYKYISIKWTNPADTDLNYIEVYENTTNTSVGATKVGISSGSSFQRTGLGISQTRWYFLKAVDYSGNASDFTTGVSATTAFIDDAAFEEGIYTLFTDQGLYAIRDVTSLPPSGAFTGEKVFNRTDGKLYQWTGSAWVLVVADVAAGSITETKIANDAITTPKLAAGAVTANEIAANTITGGLIAASGIITNSAQINDGLITNAKIANLAVDTAQIATAAITRAKIEDLAVNAAKINDLTVTTLKIANQAVSNTAAANGSLVNLTSTYQTLVTLTLSTDGGNSLIAQAVIDAEAQPVGGGAQRAVGQFRLRVGSTTIHTISGIDTAFLPMLGVSTSASGSTTVEVQGRISSGDGAFEATARLAVTELKK